MNQIARWYWLPERAQSGLPTVSRKQNFTKSHINNKSFIDQVFLVKMTGYWPPSFFASLWASTSSCSINTQKKNLANIQRSWPHIWSITHTYGNLIINRSTYNVQLISGLLIFCAVAEPRISSKSAKSHKIHEIPRNSLEILPNTCQHNIFESYLGC